MQISFRLYGGPDLQTCEQEVEWRAELPQVCNQPRPECQWPAFLVGMLMSGSNHVKGWRDSQVNYNITEDRFFPQSE